MLTIVRTQQDGHHTGSHLNATVMLRLENEEMGKYPDLTFSIKRYNKISNSKPTTGMDPRHELLVNETGDHVLRPINLFFQTLNEREQIKIYDLYAFSYTIIQKMTMMNRRELLDKIQDKVFNVINQLKLAERMIRFCKTDVFRYPPLDSVGLEPHHTVEQTFNLDEYYELTAIAVMSKMMVPIWGEMISVIEVMENSYKNRSILRDNILFDMLESSLEDGPLERVYSKLMNYLKINVSTYRERSDKDSSLGGSGASTSFILAHSPFDDEMFEKAVMAVVISKRLASYDYYKRKDDDPGPPDIMIYINEGIKTTAAQLISDMRKYMSIMPHHELPAHDVEDNSSIIDHISRTSRRSMDVPIVVSILTEKYEIDRLIEENQIPRDLFEAAARYYDNNGFEISHLTQSVMASFIGTRLGGSKCLGYLKFGLQARIVAIIQIVLIRHDLIDLAALLSSRSSEEEPETTASTLSTRIKANLKMSAEYNECLTLFKGYIQKPVNNFLKKPNSRKEEYDRIDFTNLIVKMEDWLIQTTHLENMAPVLWDFANTPTRPISGSPCVFDETIIQKLCRFYLMYHSPKQLDPVI